MRKKIVVISGIVVLGLILVLVFASAGSLNKQKPEGEKVENVDGITEDEEETDNEVEFFNPEQTENSDNTEVPKQSEGYDKAETQEQEEASDETETPEQSEDKNDSEDNSQENVWTGYY